MVEAFKPRSCAGGSGDRIDTRRLRSTREAARHPGSSRAPLGYGNLPLSRRSAGCCSQWVVTPKPTRGRAGAAP